MTVITLMGGACWLVDEKYVLREMNFMIYFCFVLFSSSNDRIIIYDNNNRFCRDEYKYNTRTLQCVLEKQERKSVWVYALDLYVLATEKR